MADIQGSDSNDFIFGTRRDDVIDSGAGNDIVLAGRGDDLVDGGDGNDIILGGSGNDVLSGGAGSDVVLGGRGHDTLVYRAAERAAGDYDVYLGGSGYDTLVLLLTGAQGGDTVFQAELAAYQASATWVPFHFTSLGLTVQSLERLVVRMDEPATEVPLATDDSASVAENGATTIDLLVNDSDPDGTTLTVTAIDARGLVGELTDNGDGTVSYDPAGAFASLAVGDTATQTFSYTVTDGNGESATASVTITIRGENDLPVVAAIDLGTVDEDPAQPTTFTADDLLAGATDVDGDTPVVTSVSVDGQALVADASGTYSYTPPADFNGTVTVDFEVSDGTATVASTATLVVTAVNDAPLAEDATFEIAEDAGLTGTLMARDVEGDTTTFSLAAPLAGLVLAADGSFTFDAGDAAYQSIALGDTRIVSVEFTVDDGNGGSDTGTATFEIAGANDDPAIDRDASDLAATQNEDTTVTGRVIASDVDGDTLAYTAEGAANGTVSIDATGAYTYTPDADFAGSDGFTVTVEDGNGGAESVEVQITVDPVNDAPTATAIDAGSISEDDAPIVVDLLATAADVDDADLAAIGIAVTDGNGAIVAFDDNGDGTITIDPAQFGDALDAGETSDLTVTYDVSDGRLAVANTATLTVEGRNEAPVASDDRIATVPSVTPFADGDLFRINTTTFDRQDNFELTALSGGGFVATWESEGQDGDDDGVFAQRFGADGEPVGEEFQVNTTTLSDQDQPAITALPDGGFVITWESSESDDDLFSYSVRGQRYGPDGTALGDEFQVNQIETGEEPSIAGLADGSFVIAWESNDNDGVFAQIYGSDGAAVGGQFRANGSDEVSGGNDPYITATALADGGFVVAWYASVGDNTGVRTQRFDAVGAPVGEEVAVTRDPDFYEFNPTVGGLAGGGFVVFWNDFVDDADVVQARLFDAAGEVASDELTIEPDAFIEGIAPTVDGGFIAALRVFASDEPVTALLRFNADGESVGDRVMIATDLAGYGARAEFARIATLDSGDLVVAWEAEAISDGDEDILAQLFTFNAPITEDAAVAITADRLLANDTDFEGNPVFLASVGATTETQGTVSLSDDGAVIYDPNGAFDDLDTGESAIDTFSYTVSDGMGGTDVATVEVVVQGVDDVLIA